VVPTDGDTVYANGFNITLDVDVNIGGANNPTVNTGSLVSGQWYEIINVGGQTWTTLGAASNTVGTVFQSTGTGTAGNLGTAKALATLTTATNTAAGATTGGGVFTMSTIRAMTCDIRPGATNCLNVTATSGTLILSGVRVLGGSAVNAYGVNTTANTELGNCIFTGGNSSYALNNASNGSVNVTGSCTFTSGSTSAICINNASTGSITVSGSCAFISSSAANSYALNNASTGTVNITGNCTFTGGAVCLNNASTGSVIISGNCTFTGGTSSTGIALNNASAGSVTVTNSTFTASAFSNAVSIVNNSADVRLSGDFLDHWSGWKAVSGAKWRLGTAPTLGQTRYALAGTTDSYFVEYGADNGSFGNPIAANVRSGVSYGGGNITGTCAVPAAGSVALGVPVDNTTGTAVLTPAAIRTELATELSRLDASVSSRLAPSGTLATVTTLTNAPTVPTAAAIATQVRTELATELARVDAAVSTRLASSAYTAPANSDVAAIKAKTDNLPSDPADQSLVVAAITAIPTVAQIRTELDSNSTKLANLDTTISSRLASSVSTNITAIKAKTDLLNTDRLAQCATTSIVGSLIAQSNS
jgi:hypothetical protein